MIARFEARPRRHSWLGVALVLTVGCAALTNPRGPSGGASQPVPATLPIAKIGTGRFPSDRPDAALHDQELTVERAVRAQLDRRSPDVKFDGERFGDVIDFMRDVSGANIFVNWKALEAAGINKNSPVIARLFNIKVSKALQVILDSISTAQTKVGYIIDEGVITITDGDDLYKNVSTRVYDIRDLAVTMPQTRGLVTVSAAGPETRPAVPQERRTREQRIEAVVNLIKDTVAPDSWGKYGQIRELSGQLLVTQLAENHVQIAALLDQLREAHGIQVSVEARFIVADKAAAEKFISASSPGPTKGKTGSAAVYLSPEKVGALLNELMYSPATFCITAPRVTCFNGQEAYVQTGEQTQYVGGYTVIRGKDGSTTYEPALRGVDTGLLLEVQPTVSADREFVSLRLHPALSRLDGMESSPFSDSPPGQKLWVQHPVITVRETRTIADIPDAQTLVLNEFPQTGENPTTRPLKWAPPTQADGAIDNILDHLGPDRRLLLLVKPTIIRQGVVDDPDALPQSNPATHRS